ncbi:MAG: prepilin-type N-terminal cleavage/methylation domain-containing protein [Gemmatimonadota bacterium]|nr:MAG: prepilin-type N-terminal cleavage/methylation domain-containing protein [Gemmatimonadota bacterium]
MRVRVGCRARGGFTVVELLVAVVVLTIGVLGLAGTGQVVASLIQAAHLRTLVRARAQAQMETLLAGGFDQLDSGERSTEGGWMGWQVSGDDPRVILIIVRQRLGRQEVWDSIATLVRGP